MHVFVLSGNAVLPLKVLDNGIIKQLKIQRPTYNKRRGRKGKKRTPSGANPDILPSTSGLMPWQIRGSVPSLPPIPA